MPTLYGDQPTVPPEERDDPATHEHDWQPWAKFPGSGVTGAYCRGCDGLLVD